MRVNNADFLDLSQEILGRGGVLRFQASGVSMRPFIEWGDVIVIEPVTIDKMCIGDVVFYRCVNSLLIAHRLIKRELINGTIVLTTKGDNLPHADVPFSSNTVLGRVIRVESRGREVELNGRWHRILGWIIAWFSGKSCGPNRTWVTRNLGRLYWLKN